VQWGGTENPSPRFSLSHAGSRYLKELHLNHASWYDYEVSFPHPSLNYLHLFDFYHEIDMWTWLRRMPNLLELKLTMDLYSESQLWGIRGGTEGWHTTLEKLQILQAPICALQLLTCPALEKLIIASLTEHLNDLTDFRNFIHQCSNHCRSLSFQHVSHRVFIDEFCRYLLPIIRSLSLPKDVDVGHLLELLSEKATDGDLTETFRFVPELENLEVIDYDMYDIDFSKFIAARWNARNRTLKSVTLVRCSCSGAAFPEFKVGEEPAKLPSDLQPVQKCVNDGLLLEIIT